LKNKEEQKKKVLRRADELTQQIDENGSYQLRVADMMLAQFRKGR